MEYDVYVMKVLTTANQIGKKKICVFCGDLWIGIIGLNKNRPKYETVIKN